MSTVIHSQLELAVRSQWRQWGHGYALYTACSSCSRIEHCRGKLRCNVLCLECFDLKKAS